MNSTKNSKPIVVKPYCKKELQNLYGISNHIINAWLKHFESELGQPVTRLYNIRQVKLIFEKLGVPGQIIEINN